MKLLNFFSRQASAPVARERLQLLLAHERELRAAAPTSWRRFERRSCR
jgi:septum formation topological specificity factor MinE